MNNKKNSSQQKSAENKVNAPSDCKHGHCDKGNHEKSSQ